MLYGAERLQNSPKEFGRLREKSIRAFSALLRKPQNAPVINAFMDAFQYKSQFEYLKESGENGRYGGNGLDYAVKSALNSAFVLTYPEAKKDHEEKHKEMIHEESFNKQVDEATIAALEQSFSRAIHDEFTVYNIAEELLDLPRRRGKEIQRVDLLSQETLEGAYLDALTMYWERKNQGTSWDPIG